MVSDDVPLGGGTAAFAHALGIDPVPDRGRFLFEITRLVYDTPEGRRPGAEAFLQAVRQSPGRSRRDIEQDTRPAETVPVPLTADVWSSAIFHRKVAREDLILAIVADRNASFIAHGLAQLDDDTLAFFSEHPAVLTRLDEHSAPLFAAFAGSLHVRANRVVPAGGDEAAALWESVLLEKTTRPDRFVLQLFELNDGRLSYLYDCVAALDPARRAFVLGAWMPDANARLDRFRALAAGVNDLREWHMRAMPFGRPSYELLTMLSRVAVDAGGAPRPPASRGYWERVFAGTDLTDGRSEASHSTDASRSTDVPISTETSRVLDADPIDAAWLMETIQAVDVRRRAERIDQLAFAQRVFGGAGGESSADVFPAVRALPRYRSLMWTLERIGVAAPSRYAAAARHAARLSAFDGRRGFDLQSQYQGALALVARMALARSIDRAATDRLIDALVALPVSDQGRYGGGIAAWLRNDVAAAIRRADTIETAVLTAMSGPPSGERTPHAPIVWEGQRYRLDLGAAELDRLRRVREKQDGAALDVPLEIAAAAGVLTSDRLTADQAAQAIAKLNAVADQVPARTRHEEEDAAASGFGLPVNVRDVFRKTLDELTRADKSGDLRRMPRIAEPLADAADQLLGQVLVSLAYAAAVGDPEGTVLLAGDVSQRHDFGFRARDGEQRLRTAWAVPRQDVMPGQPWRVAGSLLGLDVGLAPLALRRVNFERVLEAPKLTSNERETFAVSVSLMNPLALRDVDRDRITDAVALGRRRVQDLARDGHDFDPLAEELGLEGWRRRALRWTLANEPGRAATMLTLTELATLGGLRTGELDAWGMSMVAIDGCFCSRLEPPGRWSALLGRPQLGLTAAGIADVNLHVAIMLKDLQLPAALAKAVLAGAVQDFIDEVRPTDDGDWLTLARAARTITRERIEDYVAAAAAGGPLVPDNGRPASW